MLYQKQIEDPTLVFELVSDNNEITLELFEILPLERLNPRDLLQYIPNQIQLQVFSFLAEEFIQIEQPGKALVLLIEALQKR